MALQMPTQLAYYTLEDMMARAEIISKSKILGLVTPDQVVAIMMLSESEGIHPMQAIRDYHFIANKPCLKTDTVLARFHKAGGNVEWKEINNTCVSAVFSMEGKKPVPITWTIEDAKQAGLANKEVWVKYPMDMLCKRVISKAIRLIYPEAFGGLNTVEEAQFLPRDTDFIDGKVLDNPELRAELLTQQAEKTALKKVENEFHAAATSLYVKINKGEMSHEIGLSEWNNLIAYSLAKGLPEIPKPVMESFMKLLKDEINKHMQKLGEETK